MIDRLDEIRKDENLRGASALVEVAAMARVGALSAGADVTGKRATQMERDARRQERRGKKARATALISTAARLRDVRTSMEMQREKEQIRPLAPTDDGALVQGRAHAKGMGRAGLTVSLVAADGKVLDTTRSTEGGAFLLRQKTAGTAAHIIVSEPGGAHLGALRTPTLKRREAVFMDMPLDRLDPVPHPPGENGDDGETVKLTMPRVLGQTFENALPELERDFTLSEVALERVRGQAGIILGQSPEPGEPVDPGEAVKLRVGAGNIARDWPTARALIRREPAVIEAGLDDKTLSEAEAKLRLRNLNDLAALLDGDDARFAEALPGGDTGQAQAWRQAAKSVLARFPGQ